MSKLQLPEISPAQYEHVKQLTTVALAFANQGFTYINNEIHPMASWVIAALLLMGVLWILAKLFLFTVRVVMFVVLPGLAIALLAMTMTPYSFDLLFPASTALCAVVAFIRR